MVRIWSLSARDYRAASKGILIMFSNKHMAARTLIWLAAFAIPVQGLPAASCGCTDSKACCGGNEQRQRCCCSAEKVREGQCCCARREAESGHTCCGQAKSSHDSGCKCGINCQCGKAKQSQPATPNPPENNSAEKTVCDAVSAVSVFAVVHQPPVLLHRNEGSVESDAFTAQDRCVSLCRFTL
jgi:hypothetical protein